MRVETLHEVTDIERAPDGRWLVHVQRLDTTGAVVEHKQLTTTTLILAAGSLNTTRLLVRAAAKNLIPDLPDGIGGGWGTHADRIYVWTDPSAESGVPQGGPIVFGSEKWDDPHAAFTVIQASIPPLSLDPRSTIMVGYGVSTGRGTFVYDAARDGALMPGNTAGLQSLDDHRRRRRTRARQPRRPGRRPFHLSDRPYAQGCLGIRAVARGPCGGDGPPATAGTGIRRRGPQPLGAERLRTSSREETAAAGYRVRPASAAPEASRSRPNASTGPSAPVPSRPSSNAVCAPHASIAPVKS